MGGERFHGKVVQEAVSPGSKSERQAVQLVTDQGRFLLRRRGGNPFRDKVLEELVGKQIVASGRLRGNALFLDDWREESG